MLFEWKRVALWPSSLAWDQRSEKFDSCKVLSLDSLSGCHIFQPLQQLLSDGQWDIRVWNRYDCIEHDPVSGSQRMASFSEPDCTHCSKFTSFSGRSCFLLWLLAPHLLFFSSFDILMQFAYWTCTVILQPCSFEDPCVHKMINALCLLSAWSVIAGCLQRLIKSIKATETLNRYLLLESAVISLLQCFEL